VSSSAVGLSTYHHLFLASSTSRRAYKTEATNTYSSPASPCPPFEALASFALEPLMSSSEEQPLEQQSVLDELVKHVRQHDILFVLYHLKQLNSEWIDRAGESFACHSPAERQSYKHGSSAAHVATAAEGELALPSFLVRLSLGADSLA